MKFQARAPIWLMGLSNLTFGLYGSFVTINLPQLLAAQHVPEPRIAAITATVFSPGFWVFLLGPMLDVRFSRRWYATFFAAVAGVGMTVAVLYESHLAVLEAAMLLGYIAVALSANALGGWLAAIVRHEDEGKLSAWNQVANFAGGLMVILAEELIRDLPLPVAAVILGVAVFLPATIFLWMPSPAPDRRLASESFSKFFGEIFALLKRREVLITLALFLSPAASFAMTNTLGGLGADFHASARMVSVFGGAALSLAGIFGCLIFVPISKLLPLRPLYLVIGSAGAAFTSSLLLLGHTPATYGLAIIGENVFQAMAFTGGIAIVFETIGRDNPLAATQFSLFLGAINLPIIYMQLIDGRAYGWHGVSGAYMADAGVSLATCALLALMLLWLKKRGNGGQAVGQKLSGPEAG